MTSDAEGFLFAGVAPDLRLKYDIAIVGGSPRILGRGDGAAIDSHAEIIRINDGLIDGFEADVGARTTLRFVGRAIKPQSEATWGRGPLGGDDAATRDAFLARVRLGRERILGRSANVEAVRETLPDNAVYEWIDHHAFTRETHAHAQALPGVRYDDTSEGQGFRRRGAFRSGLTLALALLTHSECDANLHLFGFDLGESEERSAPYHYYDQAALDMDVWKGAHAAPDVEYVVLRQLADAGYVTLY